MKAAEFQSGDIRSSRQRFKGVGQSNWQQFASVTLSGPHTADGPPTLRDVGRPQDAPRRDTAIFRHVPKAVVPSKKLDRNNAVQASDNASTSLNQSHVDVDPKPQEEHTLPHDAARVEKQSFARSLPLAFPITRSSPACAAVSQVEARVSKSAQGPRPQRAPAAELPSRPHTVQGKRENSKPRPTEYANQGKIKQLVRKLQNRFENYRFSLVKQWFAWDDNHLGHVPLPKAKEIIKSYGLGFSDDVIDNMLNQIDNRNEGRIKFEQFTEAFRPHSLLLDEYQYSVENSFRVSIDENLPKELDASTAEKWGMAPPEVSHALAGESKLHDWLITRFGNLRDGFRHLDDKKHGAISTEDLRMKLKNDQARIGFKDEEVTALVRWADESGKGRVEWKDFAPNLDRETAVEDEYFTRSRLIAPTRSFLRAKEAPRPATSPCVTRSSVAASNEDARRIPRVFGLETGQAATGGGKRFHFPERAPTTKREGYLYGFSKGSSYVGAGFSKDAALSTRPKTGDPAYSSKRAVPTSLYQQRRVAEAAQVVEPKDGYLYGSHLHQQKVEKQHYQNALGAAALEHDYLQRKRQREFNLFDKIMQRNKSPAPENLSNLQVLQEPSKFLKAKRREMSMVHYQGTACFRSPPFRDTREAAAYNRQSVAPYVPKSCHVGACQC